VNRLTKVVHFKLLDMETAREILGKLLDDFSKRLTGRGLTVELDESAKELILDRFQPRMRCGEFGADD
jgi:ATP-dependent Clp protease ATP-binding subunit ClpA